MRPRTRLATLAGLAAAGLGATLLSVVLTTNAHAVANGEPVPEGRYRFAAKLTMTGIPRVDGTFYDSACSAALIAPQWIVTAGHCFHDAARNPVSGVIKPDGGVPYGSVTATIGRADLAGTTGHVVAVVEAYQSPGSPANDLAIAKLATPVTDIRPLGLPRKAPKVDDIVRITGWGSDQNENPVPATHPQTGQMKVSSVADDTVGVKGYLPSPDTSACIYDSGAPYFAEPKRGGPVLVGVESDGPDCPHAQEETTARVDRVVAWILDTMRTPVRTPGQ